MLFDNSNLNLKCCADCPAIFKTFNGFKKHLKTCIRKKVPSTSHDSKKSDVAYDDINCNSIDNNIESNESDIDSVITTNSAARKYMELCDENIFLKFTRTYYNKYCRNDI